MTHKANKPGAALFRSPLRAALVVALAAAVSGCSYGITVRRRADADPFQSWQASATESDAVSPRTRQTLHRLDLDTAYDHDPAAAYRRLQQAADQDADAETLFALAEISFLLGRRAEKSAPHEACAFHYLCAGYAYHYLFDAPGTAEPFDPRFRIACDLYNASLAQCIRAAQSTGRLDPRQQLALPTGDGHAFTLSVVHQGFPWRPEEFGPLLFCDDYEVVGLANRYRGYGLGAALIGTRLAPDKTGPGVSHLFFPREVSFPVTAFLRFEGSVADLTARRSGRLELYNPLTIQSVDVKGRPIPLEADLTTPLAYFLSRTDLEGVELTGLLHADRLQDRAGIYMFEPYQPGKIPVVMVHGLWSSPLTWTVMFNDLRADPDLRAHFQFWFYLYPTGDPYLATAADLRQTLTRLRLQFDPEGKDPALSNMVFVGHSMGGLVSRLLTVDSGDDFWHLVSKQPLSAIKAQPETRAEIQKLFYFARQPYVRRVVFIATPHRGSRLSPTLPARLAARLIQLPAVLTRAARDLATEDPQLIPNLRNGPLATSIDMLSPHSSALALLSNEARPAEVHYHSIIGDVTGKGVEGTDEIVAYKSAHLADVDSEIIVPANHMHVHQHPRSVLEVRRILLEHLEQLPASQPNR